MAEKKERQAPKHVAIIMDGNGRWAQKRGLPRKAGHAQGCKVVEQIVRDAADLGIDYLTVYAFSTENWKRSEEEIAALMKLFRIYIKKLQKVAMEEQVKVVVIGERSRFDEDLIEGLNLLESTTKEHTRMTFAIAINYGARDEIRRAVTKLAKEVKDGNVQPEEITEQMIASYLDTSGMPDPDLLIRTSGELRLSNFLMWQLAYTELYVTDVLWPDFNKACLEEAMQAYQKRERRYGGVLK